MKPSKEDIIKNAILEAASVVFQKWGLTKTTMEDIAKASGKGKSTLYYYYPSKEEIFYSVVSKMGMTIMNTSREMVEHEKSAETKLRTYFLTEISEIKQFINLYDIVRGEIKENPKLISRIRVEYDTEESKIINEIITLGVANREFRQFTTKEIQTVAHILVTMMRSVHIDIYIENMSYDENERINILLDIIINGLKE